MKDKIFALYKETLPDIIRNEGTVKNILSDSDNHIISFSKDEDLLGVSVINENVIYLICVKKAYQNCGIGTKLLNQSEEYILLNGFDKALIGAGKDYIMPGIPMNDDAHTFFKKHGYSHSWGDCGCYDMSLLLKDFDYNEHIIGDTINGIAYMWACENDIENIKKCVTDAQESFLEYYLNKALYESGSKTRVLTAKKDGEVLGTIIVSVGILEKDLGEVGCTTTMHKHRNQGIATNMVKLGTRYLKDVGLNKAFLGYTYTDILKMYGRAGYKVCMEYYMGEKMLK